MKPLARVQSTGRVHIYREAGYWWYILPQHCTWTAVIDADHFTRWLNRNRLNLLRVL